MCLAKAGSLVQQQTTDVPTCMPAWDMQSASAFDDCQHPASSGHQMRTSIYPGAVIICPGLHTVSGNRIVL